MNCPKCNSAGERSQITDYTDKARVKDGWFWKCCSLELDGKLFTQSISCQLAVANQKIKELQAIVDGISGGVKKIDMEYIDRFHPHGANYVAWGYKGRRKWLMETLGIKAVEKE